MTKPIIFVYEKKLEDPEKLSEEALKLIDRQKAMAKAFKEKAFS